MKEPRKPFFANQAVLSISTVVAVLITTVTGVIWVGTMLQERDTRIDEKVSSLTLRTNALEVNDGRQDIMLDRLDSESRANIERFTRIEGKLDQIIEKVNVK